MAMRALTMAMRALTMAMREPATGKITWTTNKSETRRGSSPRL
jgi:hypothetical protein